MDAVFAAFRLLESPTRLAPHCAARAKSAAPTAHRLGGGIGDRITDALLSFVNDATAEAEAFFNQADARGIFWST